MPQLPRSDSASVGLRLLLKARDAPVAVVQHDAVLARVGDLLDGQRGDPAGLAVPGGERRQVDVRERVAGDHEERLVAEELRARAHPAGRAQQLLLEAVGDALAEVLADRLREVVQVGDHAVEGVPVDQVEDVLHHRPVEHRHHRLGDLVRERAQARAESGRQNHRLHQTRARAVLARTSTGSGPACTDPRPARRCTRPARLRACVSFTPSASRCRRATFSSRCLGST